MSGTNPKNGTKIVDEYYRLSKRSKYPVEELVPLSSLKQGQKGKLVFALGEPGTIRRLCDLGLIPETEVRVLKKGSAGGPVMLEVRSSEIVIGSEIASKVLVKPL
ncbi:MAG: FeoA family protein [Candidatus Verstraetearchaeota archaeon]|nr:FeoA family protein [Candidatus Verstraetearchaeota archaeon]